MPVSDDAPFGEENAPSVFVPDDQQSSLSFVGIQTPSNSSDSLTSKIIFNPRVILFAPVGATLGKEVPADARLRIMVSDFQVRLAVLTRQAPVSRLGPVGASDSPQIEYVRSKLAVREHSHRLAV